MLSKAGEILTHFPAFPVSARKKINWLEVGNCIRVTKDELSIFWRRCWFILFLYHGLENFCRTYQPCDGDDPKSTSV